MKEFDGYTYIASLTTVDSIKKLNMDSNYFMNGMFNCCFESEKQRHCIEKVSNKINTIKITYAYCK